MQKQQQFRNSDSLEALVSMCPFKEEEAIEKSGRVYSREFQEMLDSLESEDCDDDFGGGGGPAKKRRLSSEQVRALEKHFEVENKLDPERKVKMAEELGLQPRQVAIWFQNRRARWKTKRLERDFRALKANYDSLTFDFTALKQEKENLSAEIEELKENLRRRNGAVSGDKLCSEQSKSGDFKDNGSSESDSNGVLIEESDVVFDSQLQLLVPPPGTGFQDLAGLQPPPASWFQLPDLRLIPAVKMEDQGLFDSDESCNIFSVDQAPTLRWYFPE